MEITNRTSITCGEENIDSLRKRYGGLHFVVGDTHGEYHTLKLLLKKIRFDERKDHVYFVGDYNSGGDPHMLLRILSGHYSADCSVPGFHLIRGNHERECSPVYRLENLPDVFVVRGNALTYYIAHAGMISSVFDAICADISSQPDRKVFAYRLAEHTTGYDAPFREIVWSLFGLYSQKIRQAARSGNRPSSYKSRRAVWPSEETLLERHACIIHGHTPYSFFFEKGKPGYGDRNLFWTNQHIWFSEDLQAFDIDSDVKGRNAGGETYRGLSCLCLEALEENAAQNGGRLTVEGLRRGENVAFSAPYTPKLSFAFGNADAILKAAPEMKTITTDADGNVVIL